MLVGVVYEEEYTLYGQRSPRHIDSAVVQRSDETEEDFYARLDEHVKKLTSYYSYYESEVVDAN